MLIGQFNQLKIGQTVYDRNGFGGQVSKINRTTKRINVIGLGDGYSWRYLRTESPQNKLGGICGTYNDYDVVEKMEYK